MHAIDTYGSGHERKTLNWQIVEITFWIDLLISSLIFIKFMTFGIHGLSIPWKVQKNYYLWYIVLQRISRIFIPYNAKVKKSKTYDIYLISHWSILSNINFNWSLMGWIPRMIDSKFYPIPNYQITWLCYVRKFRLPSAKMAKPNNNGCYGSLVWCMVLQ